MKFIVSLLAAWLVSLPSAAFARPAHKKALAEYFGPFLAKRLNDCRTCHLPDPPGETSAAFPQSKPHNPFGARLKAVKKELKKLGKPTDIATRLEFVAEEDADGDGVPNLIELLSGHFPGDPEDKPSPAEIEQARTTLAAFRKFRQGYPWRPFEIVKRPSIPSVKNSDWVRNPIDAFIAVEHEARGLRPRPEANKAILLRRVYLDLIGLPPTPLELHAFLHDTSSDAYEKVVDRLLSSPLYGERWGRHWMDIWRYSDWAGWGEQVRDSQPHIWRWRDWIVEALNADKGYDRMIVDMLAADEAYPEDTNALRATGYLVRNFKLLSREKWMQDTVDHTAQAFLGVTLGCARCHDHMFDPILQKEYYEVRAIFEPYSVRIDQLPGQPDIKQDGLSRVYDGDPNAKTFLFLRGDDRNPDKTPLPPGVPELLGGNLSPPAPIPLPLTAQCPDKKDYVVADALRAGEQAIRNTQTGLDKATNEASVVILPALINPGLQGAIDLAGSQKSLQALSLADLDFRIAQVRQTALVMAVRAEKLEDSGQKDSEEWKKIATEAAANQRQLAVLEARRNLLALRQTHGMQAAGAETVKKIADAEKALSKAEADAHLPATTAYTKRPIKVFPATSTGRRLAFARWIANCDNPLTARVAMNHIWLRHFGQAIVPSVFDFGQNGRRPSHPALLDWLAAEFMDQNWSMKAMHRLIVTSNTYRMASTFDSAAAAIDRDNAYLWRMHTRRMEAEAVRDCLFYVAGNLDLTIGGPDIDYKKGLTIPRRSIYFRHAAEKRMEFLQIFDGPGVTECYQRTESVVPQQALAMANSELTVKQSRLLAQTLVAGTGNDPAGFIRAAFERVLCRSPTEEEVAECLTFLNRPAGVGRRTRVSDPRSGLVHVLMNHNDFVTIR
jgi:hypothetical protein